MTQTEKWVCIREMDVRSDAQNWLENSWVRISTLKVLTCIDVLIVELIGGAVAGCLLLIVMLLSPGRL